MSLSLEDGVQSSKVIKNHEEHLVLLQAKRSSGRHEDLKALIDYLVMYRASK